jgi:hypothetical protein
VCIKSVTHFPIILRVSRYYFHIHAVCLLCGITALSLSIFFL